MFCLYTLPLARPTQAKIQMLTTSSWIVTILLKSLGLYVLCYKSAYVIYEWYLILLACCRLLVVNKRLLSSSWWLIWSQCSEKLPLSGLVVLSVASTAASVPPSPSKLSVLINTLSVTTSSMGEYSEKNRRIICLTPSFAFWHKMHYLSEINLNFH